MAGVPGFEPGNAGTKNRCLTTWRHPNGGAGIATLSFAGNTRSHCIPALLSCYLRFAANFAS